MKTDQHIIWIDEKKIGIEIKVGILEITFRKTMTREIPKPWTYSISSNKFLWKMIEMTLRLGVKWEELSWLCHQTKIRKEE